MPMPVDRPPRESQTELDRILDSLTVPQLLDIAYALKKEKSRLGASKDEVIKGLRQGSDLRHLELAAHRVEALAPFKHVFLFSFRSKSGAEVNFRADASRFGDPNQYATIDFAQEALQRQLVLLDQADNQIYLKLVHLVPIWELEETSPNEFRRRKFLHRHPIVLMLRYRTGIATLSFPGYTQGAGAPHDERLTYEELVKSCCKLIESDFELQLEGLGIRPALEALLREKPPEFRVERRRFDITKANRTVRMDIDGASEDVRDVLSEEFQGDAAAVRTTLTGASHREMRLYWFQLKVQTSLRFHDSGPEMLFLWRLGGASSSHLEYILSRVTPKLLGVGESQRNAAGWLSDRPVGHLVQASHLIQQFGLTVDQAQSLLSKAVSSRNYVLRFRIRADQALPEHGNEWVASIKDLPTSVLSEDGTTADLRDADSVEVGYLRGPGQDGHAS